MPHPSGESCSGGTMILIHKTKRNRFSDADRPVDYFGEQLKAAGYNYHGNEPMYSGITGEEFKADIYIGLVYYQRLRHMVNDKFQVRTTGPVDPLTRQPVKVSLPLRFIY
jgi:DNA-directed RNA polymerase I subunit RPA2